MAVPISVCNGNSKICFDNSNPVLALELKIAIPIYELVCALAEFPEHWPQKPEQGEAALPQLVPRLSVETPAQSSVEAPTENRQPSLPPRVWQPLGMPKEVKNYGPQKQEPTPPPEPPSWDTPIDTLSWDTIRKDYVNKTKWKADNEKISARGAWSFLDKSFFTTFSPQALSPPARRDRMQVRRTPFLKARPVPSALSPIAVAGEGITDENQRAAALVMSHCYRACLANNELRRWQ